MINIFDNYNQLTQDLHFSLMKSGYNHPTVILTETGFLPQNVITPYSYYMGEENQGHKACYFNQIKVPEYWEIRSNNSNGEVLNFDHKKANIFYAEPTHKRKVRAVEWLDDLGVVRLVEHYNQFGRLYATSNYNTQQIEVIKTYYDTNGREKIVENFVTGDIVLNHKGKVHIFKSKLEFIVNYLHQCSVSIDKIIYNSLGLPFLVSHCISEPGHDILVWQEEFYDSIPGNMNLILDGHTTRTKQIIIPDLHTYQKFHNLYKKASHIQVDLLGYIYQLFPQKKWNKNVLVLTNSDHLENIEILISSFPDITFHIAALTEMSSKLQNLGHNERVNLYPNISNQKVDDLYKMSSLYLDINFGNEILDASRRAFEAQMPILAFENTLHQKRYTPTTSIFGKDSQKEIITLIQSLEKQVVYDNLVKSQLSFAGHTTSVHYQEIID